MFPLLTYVTEQLPVRWSEGSQLLEPLLLVPRTMILVLARA